MKKFTKYHLFTITIGATSMFAQLVFMRLASTIFHGNELTFCIITGHWLLWTSLGSKLGSFILNKIQVKKLLPTISLMYILALVLFSYLIYLIRPILGISNSRVLGFGKIFIIMGTLLSIPTLVNGMFFPVLVKFIKSKIPEAPVSGIYAADVFGSAIGSLFFAALIFMDLTTFHNIHIISALVVIGLVTILIKNKKAIITTLTLFPILFISLFFIKDSVITIRWQPMEVKEYYETPYQEVVETTYQGDRVVYGNGEVMPVYNNLEFAEELVHFPLLTHDKPESILIIGLIDSTIVSQVQKYRSIKSITVINENKQLQTRLAKNITSKKISINYHFADPVTDIRKLDKIYDVAILNISQPVNILQNRFYTVEFFGTIKNILPNNGLFSMTLPGGENFLSKEHLSFLKTIRNTLAQQFDNIEWVPGETIHLLAGCLDLQVNYQSITTELKARGIDNQYITNHYLVDRLSEMKIDFLKENLNSVHEKSINTLMAPVAFFYNTILWDKKSGGVLSRLYKNLNNFNGYLVTGIIALLMVSILFIRKSSEKYFIAEMTFVGFFHMVFENLLIIIFQSFVGALYLKIVFLFFAFMTGAGLGASYFHKTEKTYLRQTPFWIMFLLPVALYFIIKIKMYMIFLLPLLLFLSGLIDGYLFPYILNRFKQRAESSLAGRLYAADVLGSCLGSYLFSAIILPIWGIKISIFFIGLVGLVMLVGELMRR